MIFLSSREALKTFTLLSRTEKWVAKITKYLPTLLITSNIMPVFYQDLSLIFFFSNHTNYIGCTARFTLTFQDASINRISPFPRPSTSILPPSSHPHETSACSILFLPMLLCLSLAVPSFLSSVCFSIPLPGPQPPTPHAASCPIP